VRARPARRLSRALCLLFIMAIELELYAIPVLLLWWGILFFAATKLTIESIRDPRPTLHRWYLIFVAAFFAFPLVTQVITWRTSGRFRPRSFWAAGSGPFFSLYPGSNVELDADIAITVLIGACVYALLLLHAWRRGRGTALSAACSLLVWCTISGLVFLGSMPD